VRHEKDWTYPHASRERIEWLQHYFATHKIVHGWHEPIKDTHVFKRSSPLYGSDSVPVHLRARADEWFNRAIAKEQAKKIPGWPSAGKIRSLKMNRANIGRHVLAGNKHLHRQQTYKMRLNQWTRYLEWLAKQERSEIYRNLPRTSSTVVGA
jgi:hypothetical protein